MADPVPRDAGADAAIGGFKPVTIALLEPADYFAVRVDSRAAPLRRRRQPLRVAKRV
jgi:hypothetical protein